MKKNIYYYEDEKIKLYPFVMFGIGVIVMIFLTVLKIKDPNNWAPYGYLIAMCFMFFWTWIAFAFAYYMTIKPRYLFLKEKKDILNNGNMINGEIIDNKKEVKLYVNGKPGAWRYYAKIKLNEGLEEKTFWTPELLFNPNNLLTNNVLVYKYNNKYYTTGFEISDNPINEKTDTEKTENENIDNNKIFKNLGMKIYLIGFSLFWFGFLIIFDYTAIQQKNVELLLFSLIFWIAGLFVVKKIFKN
ncbi:MAG: hypothetical protein PHD15_06220 [Clostridia bacterium]|nr:hypothetical protein [Clostridia bacterium]MDD4387325.1 hypothetical protein [Clostridia bacterium]